LLVAENVDRLGKVRAADRMVTVAVARASSIHTKIRVACSASSRR
jgi:hypothetical protein